MKNKILWVAVVGLIGFAGSREVVCAQRFNSVMEAMSQSGGAYRCDRSIERAFNDEMGRRPSASELSRYRALMNEDRWTESDVRNDLRRGDDRRSRYGDGDRRDRGRRDDDDRRSSYFRNESRDPDAIVRRAYQDVLNREPDKEGLRVYRSHIIDDNWSEQDVRSDLRKSPERQGRTPAAAEAVIRRAYQDILGRDADAAGLATYRAKIVNEGWSERDVRSDLKNSSEYRQKQGRK